MNRSFSLRRCAIIYLHSNWYFMGGIPVRHKSFKSKTYSVEQVIQDIDKVSSNLDFDIKKGVTYEDPYQKPILPSEKVAFSEKKLFYKINNTLNYETLCQIFVEHRPEFTALHYIASLQQISSIHKAGLLSTSDLHKNEVFLKMASDIWKNLRSFEINDHISLLKCLVDVEAPADSLIILSTLQMICHQINILFIEDILDLHHSLEKLPEIPLTSALKESLPIILQNLLQEPIPKHFSTKELSKLLELCFIYRIRNGRKILQHFFNYHIPKILHDRNPMWAFEIAQILAVLIKSRGNMRNFSDDHPSIDVVNILVKRCVQELTDSKFIGLSSKELLSLTETFQATLANRNTVLQQTPFFFKIVEHALSNYWDGEDCFNLMKYFFRMNIVCDALVKSVMEFIYSERVITFAPMDYFDLISVMAISKVEKPKAEKIITFILEECLPSDVFGDVNLPWGRLCLDLFFLELTNLNILQKVLSKEFLYNYSYLCKSEEEKEDVVMLSKIIKWKWKFYSDDMDSYFNYSFNPSEIEEFEPLFDKELLHTLRHPFSFLSNIKTDSGLIIDHLILMNSKGELRPMDSSWKNGSCLSNLNLEPDIKKLAIVLIPDESTFYPKLSNSRVYLKENLLKEEGFIIVSIFYEEFKCDDLSELLAIKLKESGLNITD